MNYHIEHHLYAAVPFFNLKKTHDTVALDMPKPPKGFLRGLRRVFVIQKEQRRDHEYCFSPIFSDTAAPPRTSLRFAGKKIFEKTGTLFEEVKFSIRKLFRINVFASFQLFTKHDEVLRHSDA
jgi:hypothetical protein